MRILYLLSTFSILLHANNTNTNTTHLKSNTINMLALTNVLMQYHLHTNRSLVAEKTPKNISQQVCYTKDYEKPHNYNKSSRASMRQSGQFRTVRRYLQ